MHIKDKKVMVTGGTSGIGLQIARAFLAAGAQVMVCSKDKTALDSVRASYPALGIYVCDLSVREQVRDLVRTVGPSVDIWVNNGGIFLEYDFLQPDKSFEALHTELEINFVAAALAITELVPFLVKKPESAIVNITAGMIFTPLVMNPMYNASKSAVHAFVVSARRQLARTGIRVIEIVPPMVATKLTQGMEGKKVSPDVIAEAVITAVTSGKEMALVGQVRSLALMTKFFPGFMLNMLNKGVPRRVN